MPIPPVSTSSKYRWSACSKIEIRSRVTPAVGSTIAMRRPANTLNSDDLPTLGLPTIVTTGTVTVHPLESACLRFEGPVIIIKRYRDPSGREPEVVRLTDPGEHLPCVP